MKKLLLIFPLIFLACTVVAQDSTYARKMMRILTSPSYNGRGYVNNGDGRAADFLIREFKKSGLQPLNGKYTQEFSFPVNVISKTPKLIINGKKLVAGRDFICSAESPSGKGETKAIVVQESPSLSNTGGDVGGAVIYVDVNSSTPDSNASYTQQWKARPMHPAAYVFAEDKLTWTARTSQKKEPAFNVLRTAVTGKPESVEYEVKAKLIEHNARNVIAVVPGVIADSFIFVTAHYDHLGRMGSVIFPGANDNASGVSMMLDLARTYAKEKPKYTMVFVGFAGEEAGLIGSKYMTENPVVPLERIRFLLNLDLMGSGDEGMMVVNGLKFEQEFALLDSINTAAKYLTNLGKRGEAKNSDHYYFTQKGVHSFFCFTLGGSKAYHDIYDRCENITLSRYNEVFSLLKNFLSAL